MKYPIVSLDCFHVVGLSNTASSEPVINMEHEAIIGGFKLALLAPKARNCPPYKWTFNIDLIQGSMEPP